MEKGRRDEADRWATAIDSRGHAAGEFLTFRLGGESYGVEILKVREIRGYETPTAIANAPAFVKGVINLRYRRRCRRRLGRPHVARRRHPARPRIRVRRERLMSVADMVLGNASGA